MSQDYSKSGGGAIPEIWSRKVINKGYANTVVPSTSNTDYTKEIKRKKKKKK